MNNKKIRVAIIGLGRLGAIHAKNVAEQNNDFDLIAVCAAEEQLKWAKTQLGISATYTDYRKMIDEEQLDAVFIVGPTALHPEMTIYALNAGLHVFCEKPLGVDLQSVNEMVQTIHSHPKQIFQSGFMRRFDSSYLYAKKMVENGEIGKIIYIRGYGIDPLSGIESFTKFATASDSGGIFLDMNIHDIDLVRWFTGHEPVRTWALANNIAAPELEKINEYETGVAQLEMDDGVIATLVGGRHAAHGYQVELEIMGSNGWIRIGEHPEKNLVTLFTNKGVVRPVVQDFVERFSQAFIDEIKAFAANIKNKTQPEATVEDGLKALKIAKACQKSVDTNQIVDIKL
ncbi:MAG: Gfo/Idh/MocA family oxidoreductase [Lactobacillus sp.]|uniref:Inositol 2-dehydrogenase n=1 Tax=Bombilactobacillus bombi TaxID=1303590 RepID=A0A3R6YT58_9LACO|nr:Gfo/Idh/MocA family oxidoreductase [Bombilactobacillus bombi]MCO6543348.1 Gfo/Idh/MocA family oxidoreductase [Lactobacillus sp.]RHW51209.1 inositol 2-dehydrogenase [Bombilactobacillus bombi]